MAYEDEEQLEAIRAWWRRNGRAVIAGVVLAVAGVLGWQQWNAYQERQAQAAAETYAAIAGALEDADLEAARNRLASLREAHEDSPYAVLASLRLASAQLAAGEPEAAAETLAWASGRDPGAGLAAIARLREAEARAAAGDDAGALAALDPVPDGPLRARYLELRGDLLVARGEREAAIEAYRGALAEAGSQRRGLVEVKLTDLGVDPAS